MIPLDQASPAVGMAGIRLGLTDAPRPSRRWPLGLTPVGAINEYRAAGVRQESGRFGGGCWPGRHARGFGPTGEGATGGTGLARQMARAVVLDDSSRHAATTDRCTSGYDELAGHRPCTAPEPLLPRRARAPVNAPLALAATASGRADPQAGGIPRPGPGGRRRSADEWSWTAGRAHRRPACSGGPRGGPRWRRPRLPP